MHKDKKFSILIIIAILTSILLGFWQMKRSEDKISLNNAIKNSSQNPIIFTSAKLQPYHNYIVSGFYDFSKQILLGPRTYNNQLGMYVYTIFVTENNQYLLVNRGFVTKENSKKINSLGTSERLKINVFSHIKPKQSWYSPKNYPNKNQWVSLNLAEIESFFKIELGDYYFKEISNLKQNIDIMVENNFSADYHIDNIHVKYIYFWFLLAFTFFIMLIIYVRNKAN